MTTIAKIWLIIKINIFKIPIVTTITLFWCIYFIKSIPPNQFCRILALTSCLRLVFLRHLTHTNSRLNLLPSSKRHQTIIFNRYSFNGLFNGKLSSVLNLIFIKSLPYSHFHCHLLLQSHYQSHPKVLCTFLILLCFYL